MRTVPSGRSRRLSSEEKAGCGIAGCFVGGYLFVWLILGAIFVSLAVILVREAF